MAITAATVDIMVATVDIMVATADLTVAITAAITVDTHRMVDTLRTAATN